MIIMMGKQYLTEKDCSKRYGYSRSWFEQRRGKDQPPYCFRLLGKGKVLYPLSETDKWFEENLIKNI
jgi:predicted DNA-binding transcriptional regulator AlpA